MSTSTPGSPDNPEGSGTPAAAGDQGGASTPGKPDANPTGKPGGKFWAIAGIVAVALGVAGFFIGQSVTNDKYKPGKADYDKIYNAGVAAGTKAGTAAGISEGQRAGKAQGLQIGQKAGMNEGLKQGLAQGTSAGRAEGFKAGVQSGAAATLGGLTGWNTNVPYVVELDPSPVAGVPYQIYSRTLMKPGFIYKLCANGVTLCVGPVPAPPPAG